jgi:ribose 5-phosphate isomerase A
VVRRLPDGQPVTSDNGNYIIDCHFSGGVDDAEALDGALAARAGVVESGLFLGMATHVLVSSQEGVRSLFRDEPT